MINETALKGVYEINLSPIKDDRGYFLKYFTEDIAKKIGAPMVFPDGRAVDDGHRCLRAEFFEGNARRGPPLCVGDRMRGGAPVPASSESVRRGINAEHVIMETKK